MEHYSHPTKTWWLVPIFGPHIGAILGAGLYVLCVGMHLPETSTAAKKHPEEAEEFALKEMNNRKLQLEA